MANPEHLAILKQGVEVWNKWRSENPQIKPNLSNAHLRGASLRGADLKKVKLGGADLRGADLREAEFYTADLKGTLLNGAKLWNADLGGANLSKANLREADIRWANISEADLSRADLRKAILAGSNLSETNFENSDLTGCHIYAISAWNLKINKKTKQTNLIISRSDEPTITVDNLEVAQFVYLLLHNDKIRDVIDTIGKKGVLILGRFTEERKAVLDAIRNKLRELGFIPMMFDFEKPTQRDFTETIKIIAGMSRFIIADITNPKSSPLELQATMPDYMIPFVPIIQEDEKPFAMFQDLKQKYGEWVLDPLEYDTAQGLLDVFDEAVVAPANKMAGQLELKKAEKIRTRHVKDYKKTRPLRKTKKMAKA